MSAPAGPVTIPTARSTLPADFRRTPGETVTSFVRKPLDIRPEVWDDGGHVKLNGHAEMIDGVPPYSAMLTLNEWPAGCIDPAGGVMISPGGEDAFIAACEAALSVATETELCYRCRGSGCDFCGGEGEVPCGTEQGVAEIANAADDEAAS